MLILSFSDLFLHLSASKNGAFKRFRALVAKLVKFKVNYQNPLVNVKLNKLSNQFAHHLGASFFPEGGTCSNFFAKGPGPLPGQVAKWTGPLWAQTLYTVR